MSTQNNKNDSPVINEASQPQNIALSVTTLMRELAPRPYNELYDFIFHKNAFEFKEMVWQIFSEAMVIEKDKSVRGNYVWTYESLIKLIDFLFSFFRDPMAKLGYQNIALLVQLREEEEKEASHIIDLFRTKSIENYKIIHHFITFDEPQFYKKHLLKMFFSCMAYGELSERQEFRESLANTCSCLVNLIDFLDYYFSGPMGKLGFI